jgi:hypothetical protein
VFPDLVLRVSRPTVRKGLRENTSSVPEIAWPPHSERDIQSCLITSDLF